MILAVEQDGAPGGDRETLRQHREAEGYKE